ncbi:MAG TPA: hypothetical protein VFX21_12215, partial [Acidimicrobiia bacterium]|nr:hypothetical protein [Acidimicrobiia bacterium]
STIGGLGSTSTTAQSGGGQATTSSSQVAGAEAGTSPTTVAGAKPRGTEATGAAGGGSNLPFTGGNLTLLWAGLAALGAGGALYVNSRRRSV